MVYDLTINSLIESKKHINIHEIDVPEIDDSVKSLSLP